MFTALILMCALHTEGESPSTCFAIEANQMFDSQTACEDTIKKTIELGALSLQFKGFEPKDWYCVNWTGLKA
jgi:hypothetical protein